MQFDFLSRRARARARSPYFRVTGTPCFVVATAFDISRDIYLSCPPRTRLPSVRSPRGRKRAKGTGPGNFFNRRPSPGSRLRRRRECRASCNYSPMNFRLFRDLFRSFFLSGGGSKSAKLSRGYPLAQCPREWDRNVAELVSIISPADVSSLNSRAAAALRVARSLYPIAIRARRGKPRCARATGIISAVEEGYHSRKSTSFAL